jgi:hypothetical protein
MSNFLKIGLEELRKRIEQDVFKWKFEEGFIFLPTVLYNAARSLHLQTSIKNIENWEDFESDEIDFNEKDFEKIIFSKSLKIHQIIYLVSDETLKANFAYKLDIINFYDFIVYYEREFKTSFFQPLDYIVVFENPWRIEMIYHEGKQMTILPSAKN